ncbi:porin [Paraburkholderia madseniana]|uniref:porin n=1 Tax=Paraburkholderia madseniana TaxID=2599607 RepID=UPI001559D3B9|nr:porin [Paraburkholderia madseniana]NPT64273.1 porin [Paraburkholderia madseniana]
MNTNSGMYGFSNAAGDFANNRAYAVTMSYVYGGLTVAAAYMQFDNTLAPTAGIEQITNANGAIVADKTFAASRQRTWGAGANYAIGALTLGLVFTQTRLDHLFGVTASALGLTGGLALDGLDARFNNFEAHSRYMLTPAWSVSGAYTYTDARLNGRDPKWSQVSVQASYLLLRYTDVYLQAQFRQIDEDGLDVGADIFGLSTASSSNRQVAVTIGMRHRF